MTPQNRIATNITIPADALNGNFWTLPTALDLDVEVEPLNLAAILCVYAPSQEISEVTFIIDTSAPDAAVFTGNVPMEGATIGGDLTGDLTDNVALVFNNPQDSGCAYGNGGLTVTTAGKLRLAVTTNGAAWTPETALIIQSANWTAA